MLDSAKAPNEPTLAKSFNDSRGISTPSTPDQSNSRRIQVNFLPEIAYVEARTLTRIA